MISGSRFGSMPTWWSRDAHLFTNLKANQTGVGISAMKCLIALSVLIDFKSREVETSIGDLEKITGLSRPMVLKGVDKLQELNIIEIDKSQYKNKYTLLVANEDPGWAKVPVNKVRKELQSISNRGIAPFAALKIYITLLALRYRDNDTVTVSHSTLRDYTKVQPTQIKAGLDVLFSNRLLHVAPKRENTANEYIILGL